jgi:hypothetical protein
MSLQIQDSQREDSLEATVYPPLAPFSAAIDKEEEKDQCCPDTDSKVPPPPCFRRVVGFYV